jgi:hypothetical protein
MTTTTLATRNISGQGVLQVPTGSPANKCKLFTVTTSLLRPPTSKQYNSVKWSPAKGYYGTIIFLRDRYVQYFTQINFEMQIWDIYAEPGGQGEYAIKCAYSGILQSIANLGTALGVVPISIINNIASWTPQNTLFDSIQIVASDDAAIQVTLTGTTYDVCPDDTSTPPPKPTPAPPQTPVAPGTALPVGSTGGISAPYVPPSDGGLTVPNPLDAPITPPPPATCDKCLVTLQLNFSDGSTGTTVGVGGNPTGYQYAPIVSVYVTGDPGDVATYVVGGIAVGSPCDRTSANALLYNLNFNPGRYTTSASIINVEVIP